MARSKKADAIQVINNYTEEIREVNIYDLTRNAYIEFGRHINNWRQLPQIIDGLKISYRRLLYSALQFPQGKMIKSVMLLGKMSECFTGDTEVLDVNNNRIKFKELKNKIDNGEDIYVFSCDTSGNPSVSKVLNVVEKGKATSLVKITLDNGESFTCTKNHKILLRPGTYIQAKNIFVGSSVMPIYIRDQECDYNNRRRSIKTNQYNKFGLDVWTPIYKLSSNHADCRKFPETLNGEDDHYARHHEDFNSLNDYPTNIIFIGNKYHRSLHGISSLRKIQKNLKDNNEEFDELRIRYSELRKSGIKDKAMEIIQFLRDSGLEFNSDNYSKYREIIRNDSGTKYIGINLLVKNHRKFLEENGFDFSSYEEPEGMVDVLPSLIPESCINGNNFFVLNVIRRVIYKALSDGVTLFTEDNWDKYIRSLRKPYVASLKHLMSTYSEVILSFGIDVSIDNPPEFKGKYWSTGIGTKIYNILKSMKSDGLAFNEDNFNKKCREIYKKPIWYKYACDNLPEIMNEKFYNNEVGKRIFYKSNDRSLIYMDDLGNHKVSKVEFIDVPEGELVYDLEVDSPNHNFSLAAGTFAHNCHEHSTDGSYGVVAAFVKSGVFTGQGSWGVRSINGNSDPAAAPRYTEARVSDKYYELLGRLIKKVPYIESPVGPLEPTFIPTVVPMSLCLDTLVSGIGLGISTDLPNFSAKSMYEAYIHDDPTLLEPNIDIQLLKDKSELHRLWNEGKGRVVYAYRYSRIKSPDGNPGMLIEGDAGIFVPKLKRIKDWEAEGKVYIEDMVTQDGAKLAIFKVPNIKSISIDDIEAEVAKICVNNNTYNLNVSDGNSAFRIPLREWIKATYTNYINLVNQDNLDQIEATKFDIEVYSNIEQVANYIINVNPKAENEEISQATGIRMEVINAIMSRTISNLRKTKDQTEKVKSLKDKLKELKSFDAVRFTDEIVNKL